MKFGDKLPQALTIDEMTSIRNWADTLYGSYDPDKNESYYLVDAPFTFMATAKFHF